MAHYKGFRIRIYPSKEQEELLWRHLGCCRFIWNYLLNLQIKLADNNKAYMSIGKMMHEVVELKRYEEFTWLTEVSAHSLFNTCRDLDFAFQLWFKGISRYPKFKSKKDSNNHFPVRRDRMYFKSNNIIHLEKFGDIPFRTDFVFVTGRDKLKFYNPRIEYTDTGKWMLSFSLRCENQALNLNEFTMGIDLGIKKLAVVSFGNQMLAFENINKTKKMRYLDKQIRFLTRKLDKKFTANGKQKSNNFYRLATKIRKLYAKQTNIRNNYIHQITRSLVDLAPACVVMEDLDISGLLARCKSRNQRKCISEQKWYMFIKTMEYKCNWAGIEFIKADRYFPSTKRCSRCGHLQDMPLDSRTYNCPKCGLIIDRDENAANNLRDYIIYCDK